MYRYERPTISVTPEPVESFRARAGYHTRQILGTTALHHPKLTDALVRVSDAISRYPQRVAQARTTYGSIDRLAFVAPDFSSSDALRISSQQLPVAVEPMTTLQPEILPSVEEAVA